MLLPCELFTIGSKLTMETLKGHLVSLTVLSVGIGGRSDWCYHYRDNMILFITNLGSHNPSWFSEIDCDNCRYAIK